MKTPHKHAELIKAWADGAEIEFWNDHRNLWQPVIEPPVWNTGTQYRIKPEPKPNVIRYAYAILDTHRCWFSNVQGEEDNIRLTFDGETGKLKKAEVLE